MNQTLTLDLTPEQATELQALLEKCVQEVRAADERMGKVEAERLQLQTETRALLRQLRETLHIE
jgi:signal transduction histidine kinase